MMKRSGGFGSGGDVCTSACLTNGFSAHHKQLLIFGLFGMKG